jgi:hypothetical protein
MLGMCAAESTLAHEPVYQERLELEFALQALPFKP